MSQPAISPTRHPVASWLPSVSSTTSIPLHTSSHEALAARLALGRASGLPLGALPGIAGLRHQRDPPRFNDDPMVQQRLRILLSLERERAQADEAIRQHHLRQLLSVDRVVPRAGSSISPTLSGVASLGASNLPNLGLDTSATIGNYASSINNHLLASAANVLGSTTPGLNLPFANQHHTSLSRSLVAQSLGLRQQQQQQQLHRALRQSRPEALASSLDASLAIQAAASNLRERLPLDVALVQREEERLARERRAGGLGGGSTHRGDDEQHDREET
mmetsp:Transcript_12513/g.18398  ORF Transcript_12513/g.18398 Transcript_12513/m.18398 type:complete len:276 (-) Transcript_12513:520-1347(-)